MLRVRGLWRVCAREMSSSVKQELHYLFSECRFSVYMMSADFPPSPNSLSPIFTNDQGSSVNLCVQPSEHVHPLFSAPVVTLLCPFACQTPVVIL